MQVLQKIDQRSGSGLQTAAVAASRTASTAHATKSTFSATSLYSPCNATPHAPTAEVAAPPTTTSPESTAGGPGILVRDCSPAHLGFPAPWSIYLNSQ